MGIIRVIVGVATLLCVSSSFADGVTKWVDENGNTHYGEKAPSEARVVEMRANLSVSGTGDTDEDQVILYSTSWCGYCKRASEYMKQNGIRFREFDIERDPLAKRRYEIAGGGSGVPFLVRGKSSIYGFSTSRYDQFFAGK